MPRSVRTTRTSLHSSLIPEKSANSPWSSSSQSESVVVGTGSFAFSFFSSFDSEAEVEAGWEAGVLDVDRRPARNPPTVPARRRARVALYSWTCDSKDIFVAVEAIEEKDIFGDADSAAIKNQIWNWLPRNSEYWVNS